MGDEIRWKLADKIFDALERADLGAAATIERLDDGTVLGVDLVDPEAVYIVTVSSAERID
jgi:hypothetical protein